MKELFKLQGTHGIGITGLELHQQQLEHRHHTSPTRAVMGETGRGGKPSKLRCPAQERR